MSTILTKHAEGRSRKRLGLNKKSVEKDSQAAFENGITHAEAKGHLKRFIDKLFLSHQKATNIRVYNGGVYLFAQNVLITIVPLPGHLRKISESIQRKKAQNALRD